MANHRAPDLDIPGEILTMLSVVMETKKIQSIEFGRVIAIFAIVAMHCGLFLSYWQHEEVPWFGYLFNQATRFAVPLFFLVAGYLIQPKITAHPIATLRSYSLPLIRVFVVWSIICLLMPFNFQALFEHGYLAERQYYWGYLAETPVNSLLEGGLVHLWFIPALLLAVAVCALLAKFKALHLLLPLGVVLYVYGALAGSYHVVTDLWSPFFTRNGPFFSTLLFAIGFTIRQRSIRLSSSQALAIALIGMACHFAEAFFLYGYGQGLNENDYVFGTFLWGSGLFLWLLAKPDFGAGSWLTSLSKYVLPIYVAHLPISILMMNFAGFNGLYGAGKDLVVFFGTVLLTFLLMKGTEKTPIYRWLFR